MLTFWGQLAYILGSIICLVIGQVIYPHFVVMLLIGKMEILLCLWPMF